MRITFELSESDLSHFRAVMQNAVAAAKDSDPKTITDAANQLLEEVQSKDVPEFVSDRLVHLRDLIDMVHDEGWALQADDKQRVLNALAYFGDPADLIPDDIPGIGLLDDAIMVELVLRELRPEIEAYRDFVIYRQREAQRRKLSIDEINRSKFLDDRRRQLHTRMRNRRRSRSRRRRSSSSSTRGGSFF